MSQKLSREQSEFRCCQEQLKELKAQSRRHKESSLAKKTTEALFRLLYSVCVCVCAAGVVDMYVRKKEGWLLLKDCQ